MLRWAYSFVSLAGLVVCGNLAALVFGDCGWVYHYAAMGGAASGWGAVGSFYFMWKVSREPIWLAQLAYQMRREAADTESPETVRAHYARLAGVVEDEAERRQPGSVRLAWEERERRNGGGVHLAVRGQSSG